MASEQNAAPTEQSLQAQTKQDIKRLLTRARSNIQQLKPYSSARLHTSAQELQNNILLNANENPYAPPSQLRSYPNKRWDTAQFNYYPEPQPQELITALAALYAVRPQQLIVGRGSDEAIDLLIRAFCGEQDAIIICSPTFGMYYSYANIQGCRVLDIPLEIEGIQKPKPNSWTKAKLLTAHLPVLQIEQVITAQAPKLLFLPSPLAPLGCEIPNQQLQTILELCAQNDVFLVIDEAYAEFAQILSTSYQSYIPILRYYPNLIVLRTLSKAYSLAGERIGSLLAAPELIQLLRPIQSPYPIPASISHYVSQLLKDSLAMNDMAVCLEQLCQQHAQLFALLEGLPYVNTIFNSVANFVMVQVDCAQSLLEHCSKQNIILRNFSQSIDGAVRISLGNAEQMEKLFQSLKQFT